MSNQGPAPFPWPDRDPPLPAPTCLDHSRPKVSVLFFPRYRFSEPLSCLPGQPTRYLDLRSDPTAGTLWGSGTHGTYFGRHLVPVNRLVSLAPLCTDRRCERHSPVGTCASRFRPLVPAFLGPPGLLHRTFDKCRVASVRYVLLAAGSLSVPGVAVFAGI